MSNWCSNILRVAGSVNSRREFLERFNGYPVEWKDLAHVIPETYPLDKQLCFNALYPIPKEIAEQGLSKEGYQWCTEHWGTKWDVYGDVGITDQDRILEFTFETVEQPPVPWLIEVAKEFTSLNFQLFYLGQERDFTGRIEIDGGLVVSREETQLATYGDIDLLYQAKQYGFEIAL
jgi:hypothetical protein